MKSGTVQTTSVMNIIKITMKLLRVAVPVVKVSQNAPERRSGAPKFVPLAFWGL